MVMENMCNRKMMVLVKGMAVEMVTKIAMVIAMMMKTTMEKGMMLGYLERCAHL